MSNLNKEYQNINKNTDNPIPPIQIEDVKMPCGKYRGWNVSAVKDIQYLEWFRNNVPCESLLKTAINERLYKLRSNINSDVLKARKNYRRR